MLEPVSLQDALQEWTTATQSMLDSIPTDHTVQVTCILTIEGSTGRVTATAPSNSAATHSASAAGATGGEDNRLPMPSDQGTARVASEGAAVAAAGVHCRCPPTPPRRSPTPPRRRRARAIPQTIVPGITMDMELSLDAAKARTCVAVHKQQEEDDRQAAAAELLTESER